MKFVNTSWFREGTKHFQPEWLVAPLYVHWKEISFISSHSINKIREDCDITSCQPSSFHCLSLRRSVSQRSWMHEEAYHKIRMQKRYLTNTPQKKVQTIKSIFMKQSASYLHHEIINIHGTCPLAAKLRLLKDAINFLSNVEILLYFLQDNLEMYFNARVSAGFKRVNLRLF